MTVVRKNIYKQEQTLQTIFQKRQYLTGFAYSSKFRVLKTFEVFKDRIPSPVSFDVALPVSFEDDFSVVML